MVGSSARDWYDDVSSYKRNSYGIPKSSEAESWDLPPEKMSVARPGYLVIEVSDKDGRKKDRFMWMKANHPSLTAALEREQVLEGAYKARARGNELRAYFNGEEVTEQLYELVERVKTRGGDFSTFLPVLEKQDRRRH